MRFALSRRAEEKEIGDRRSACPPKPKCIRGRRREIGDCRGFTLIELTIYVGIVAMILVALVFTTNVMYDARARVRTSSIVHENISYAVQRIAAAVREASSVTAPAAGASSTTLQLTMTDATANPTIFRVSSQRIYLQMGTSPSLPITSQEVQITSATFTVSNANPPSVRVEVSGDKTNAQADYSSPFTLSETATIRRE
ncbi:MAG: type II secretion system protein [Patescibacteria group bacterium]